MVFRHHKIRIFSFLMYGVYTYGVISNITSTKAPLTLIVTMSSSFSTFVFNHLFWMLMAATYLPYCGSMMQVSSNSYVATVGELVSSLEMKSFCLFPPATVLPLVFPYLFILRNIEDFKNYAFYLLVRSYLCLGSNVFWRWSCLISNFI